MMCAVWLALRAFDAARRLGQLVEVVGAPFLTFGKVHRSISHCCESSTLYEQILFFFGGMVLALLCIRRGPCFVFVFMVAVVRG